MLLADPGASRDQHAWHDAAAVLSRWVCRKISLGSGWSGSIPCSAKRSSLFIAQLLYIQRRFVSKITNYEYMPSWEQSTKRSSRWRQTHGFDVALVRALVL